MNNTSFTSYPDYSPYCKVHQGNITNYDNTYTDLDCDPDILEKRNALQKYKVTGYERVSVTKHNTSATKHNTNVTKYNTKVAKHNTGVTKHIMSVTKHNECS